MGDVAAKRAELSAIWPRFAEVLVTSPHLTRFDAAQIASEVKADLRGRVDALDSGGLFETRGWGTDRKETYQPANIDFGLVPTLRTAPDKGELSLRDPAV